MKFTGSGILKAPGSGRVIWDFEDGPFATHNPEIIKAALKQGFVEAIQPQPSEPKVEAEPPAPKRKAGKK